MNGIKWGRGAICKKKDGQKVLQKITPSGIHLQFRNIYTLRTHHMIILGITGKGNVLCSNNVNMAPCGLLSGLVLADAAG